MRKDHTPYWLAKWRLQINQFFVRKKIAPQFDQVGADLRIHKPQHLEITGKNIRAGKCLHVICARHKPVQLACWRSKQHNGQITIGDHVLISPGVSILSAEQINIGDNTMIAADVAISDCDWHGLYNRLRPFRCSRAITLAENVWIGQRSIINKGVTIGKNSVIAAGSVVTGNVPENSVYGGNPAKLIKHINPKRRMLTRATLFQDHDYWQFQEDMRAYGSANNRFWYWLKTCISPSKKD